MPEPEPELETMPEPESAGSPERLDSSGPAEPETTVIENGSPDPRGGGDSAAAGPSAARAPHAVNLLDTTPLELDEVIGTSDADPEMALGSNDTFMPATEFFHDAAALDSLAEHGDGRLASNIARNSLFVKFDPLLGRPSVLPQLDRQAGTQQEEPPPAVPRQLSTVKADLIAFSPAKEAAEPTPDAAQPAEPEPEPAPETALATTAADNNHVSAADGQALKKQEFYYRAELLKREKELATMREALAKPKQRDAEHKQQQLKLSRVVELHTKALARLAIEKEQTDAAVRAVSAERDEARQEVANVESMFADLHRKYEKSKSLMQENRQRSETISKSWQSALDEVSRERQRHDMLQKYAEDTLQRLREDMELAEKSHETELLRLTTKLQLLENRNTKLERENQEVTAICDELIQKMGGAR
ncbi:transforming acidic coiled-coil-containing protein 3-like [Pollicipes pollicipes]|uniref:transforming acidic coiled-coil-containing protein 3-like n=1 Tax=Pollicipes pollicipes TaxID=41117 RepID=UPI0018859811|nr:transforming acidic coiled-coil-containing protein 3-like [Pollicipes pollicipes]